MKCPICDEKIDSYYDCEQRCSSTEIWWCNYCGAIALGWNGNPPDKDSWTQTKAYKKAKEITDSFGEPDFNSIPPDIEWVGHDT